jgi:hypothetical protein
MDDIRRNREKLPRDHANELITTIVQISFSLKGTSYSVPTDGYDSGVVLYLDQMDGCMQSSLCCVLSAWLIPSWPHTTGLEECRKPGTTVGTAGNYRGG